jgi:hypothetical protein
MIDKRLAEQRLPSDKPAAADTSAEGHTNGVHVGRGSYNPEANISNATPAKPSADMSADKPTDN